MSSLLRRLMRRGTRADAAAPGSGELRHVFTAVDDARRRQETEGRHLFHELARHRTDGTGEVEVADDAAVRDTATVSAPETRKSRARLPLRFRIPAIRMPAARFGFAWGLHVPRPRLTKGRLSIASALAVALAIGTGVFAYWTTGGTGSASALASSLASPSVTATNPTPNVAHIAWTSVASPDSPTLDSEIGFTVERKPSSGSTWVFVCGTGTTQKPYNVLACDDTLSVEDDYDYRVTAHFRSWTSEDTDSVHVDVDLMPPMVSSIDRLDPTPTNASSVSWKVTFSEDVSGVGVGDFALVGPGATGASITTVAPSGPEDEYTVQVATGSDGTIGLNLVDDDSVQDGAGNKLGGTNIGNGNFTGQTYVIDKTGPTNVLSLIAQSPVGGSYYVGAADVVFYRGTGGGAGGTFKIRNALADAGTGPASSTTAALGGTTTGWSHSPSIVSTPTGGPYDSNSFSWTEGTTSQPTELVTGTDNLGNTTAVTLTFKNDTTAPAGGALTVNGTAATGGGTSSSTTANTFMINLRTDYTETQSLSASGLGSSVLVRESATLSNNICGVFGSATTIVGAPNQNPGAGIATGNCYRYTLTGTDNVGNATSISTTVKVDTTAPNFGSPALTLSDIGAFAFTTGTTAYYNGASGASSSITVNAPNVADPETAIQKVNFPTLGSDFAGGGDDTTSPYSATYTWSNSADSGTKTVTATNGITNASTSTFSLVRDVTAPGSGALTVNGTAASGPGTTSNNTTGSFTIGTRTDYSEAQNTSQAGLASSTLVREQATLTGNACGSFGSAVTIVGSPAQSLAGGSCYRYTLTGVDNVNNTASISTTVRVDTSAPSFGTPALTLSTTGTFAHYPGGSSTTVYYNGTTGTSSSLTVNAPNVSDPETGVQSVTFPSLSGFTGGGADASAPYSATYTWSTGSDSGSKSVIAANAFASTSSSPFTLVRDVTAPTSGALTVNSLAGSNAGTTSYSTTGTFSGTRTDYTEVQSGTAAGLLSSALVRTQATYNQTTGACGSFGSATSVVGAPSETSLSEGCYRYTLTGTDNVGNAASIATTVIVDKSTPTVASVTLNNSGGPNAGRIESDDTIVITFSEQMKVSSFCSAWTSGDGNDQSLAANGDNVVLTVTDGTGATNDSITVTSTTCSFNLGSINLGSNNYTSGGNSTFSGTGNGRTNITWNASTRTLTIELGNKGGAGTVNTVASSIATYNPSALITDSAGNGSIASKATGNVQHF